MRNGSELKAIIITVGILFVVLSITNYNTFNDQDGTIDNRDKSTLKGPKSSGFYNESFIHVDGNWSDTVITYDWCNGDGSWNNPYTIENVMIDAGSSPTGSGILINNSKDEYFIIQNCTVYNAVNGIMLENTDKGTITNNNSTINDRGIWLYDNCKNNTISKNIANNNLGVGIKLEINCDNNVLSGNKANGPDQNNGIRIFNGCDNNNVSGNTANDNIQLGIQIANDCNFNIILANTVNDNDLNGIYFSNGCSNNTISENTANDNDGGSGITLGLYCDNNTISGNIAHNNLWGIFLSLCDDNIISGNIAITNGYLGPRILGGISLGYCDNNTIMGNTVEDNLQYGMLLDSHCSDNLIYLNGFTGNGYHVRDEGNNQWDNGAKGNYWDNYTGNDDYPIDGIGEFSYSIPTNKFDTRPLIYPLWDDTDGDGLNNLEEYTYGTNVVNPDSDNDGLSDYWEWKNSMNPLNPNTDGDLFDDGVEIGLNTDPLDPLWYPMPNLKVSHFSSIVAYLNTSIVLDFSISNNGIWKAEGVIVIIRCEELDLTLFNNTESPFNIEVDDTEYISIGCLPFEITGEFTLSLIVDPGNLIYEMYSLKNGSLRTDWDLDNSMQAILSIICMEDNDYSGGGSRMDPALMLSLGGIAGVAFGAIATLGVIKLRKRRKLA